MLKSQMESDRKAFEAVSDENRKLLGVIEELNTKIRNLQGEVSYGFSNFSRIRFPWFFLQWSKSHYV